AREAFQTIKCTDNEGKIVPIVYGEGVRRVPARLIAQPGHCYLAAFASEHATTLSLTKTCAELGVSANTEVSLIVGTPQMWERITGEFSSSGSNTFSITSRSS